LTLRTVSFTDLNSVLCMMVGPRDSMLLSFVNEIVARQIEPVTLNALLKQLQ
jgi:hypothetical protein